MSVKSVQNSSEVPIAAAQTSSADRNKERLPPDRRAIQATVKASTPSTNSESAPPSLQPEITTKDSQPIDSAKVVELLSRRTTKTRSRYK